MIKMGIDLGGTKIEGIILSESMDELFRQRVETRQEEGYLPLLNRVKSLYMAMCSIISNEPHTLGIGTPGSSSVRSGLLKNSNTLCLNGKPVKQDLEDILQRGILIENDANCFALAEAGMGAGKGYSLVFGVIMGTGCGGGIVYKGKLLSGLNHIAGEWGHMTINPSGPPCYCGSRGCVETYISGGGLQSRYREKFGEGLSLKEIINAARQGNPGAATFMEEFYSNFGRSMANVINILDPDMVVLGGGVSNLDTLYSTGVKMVQSFIFNDECATPIKKNQLGDSAGVIGAALLGN